MSQQTVRLNVGLTIDAENFDKFERIAKEMTARSRSEPGTVAYEWFLSGDRRSCRLIETHADANPLLQAHFSGSVVQEFVPKLLEVSSLSRFEVYGDIGTNAPPMLAGAGTFGFWLGLGR